MALTTHARVLYTFGGQRLRLWLSTPFAIGSLPGNRSFPSATTSGQAFLTMDRILDNACTGPLYLRRPEVATMVVDAIRYRQQCLGHYQIHAYRHGEPRSFIC